MHNHCIAALYTWYAVNTDYFGMQDNFIPTQWINIVLQYFTTKDSSTVDDPAKRHAKLEFDQLIAAEGDTMVVIKGKHDFFLHYHYLHIAVHDWHGLIPKLGKHTQMHTHTYTHTNQHTHTRAAHTNTHQCGHTHTHTYIHTHTHTLTIRNTLISLHWLFYWQFCGPKMVLASELLFFRPSKFCATICMVSLLPTESTLCSSWVMVVSSFTQVCDVDVVE